MLLIDRYAYTNRLKDVNPMIKFIFCTIILIFTLMNKRIYVFLLQLIFLCFFTLYTVRIPFKNYLKLLAIPLTFIIISIITVIFSIGTNKDLFFTYIKLKNYYIGITYIGISQGIMLFFKAICSVEVTYLLALTIPMDQLITVFKILRLPKVFIEITVLMYRFIFIFLEELKELYVAQNLKFGYKNIKVSYKSTALLIRILFIRVIKRYEELNISLETKLYNGEFYI